MPRNYKKKVGGRIYRVHDPDVVSVGIKDIQKGMSIAQASRKHGIPRMTLQNKFTGQHLKQVGGQPALTVVEEKMFVSMINELSKWSYPVTKTDLKIIIKKYLDKKGRKIDRFKNNMPGNDFLQSFMRRHNLTQRLATNISRARTSVSEKQVSDFFENIRNKLIDVPPTNIFNFDETNLTDDPGAKKVIVFRGSKRVERVMEHSKVAVSLMFCISADGEILPPFVVYKAENLYENWCTGGPPGTQYGISKSGWFDAANFEMWFRNIFLPHVKDKSGDQIVIADNLSSHFSPEVIDMCRENNIYFTTIPPNSTHLMQPLDVAFFKPLKVYWRGILDEWRKESRRQGAIPKEIFPNLLSKLYEKLLIKGQQNARSGFRKTGIYPFNPNQVLNMLPGENKENFEEMRDVLNTSVLDYLKEQRGNKESIRRKRGKKVTPGCAIGTNSNQPTPSASKQQGIHNENFCGICQCNFHTYRGPDWIQCTDCNKWICGFCNGRSKDLHYICEACMDEN